MSSPIAPWKCSLCQASLESGAGVWMLLGLRAPNAGGQVCSRCRYRVCARCLDEKLSRRDGQPVCRACAASPNQINSQPQGKTP